MKTKVASLLAILIISTISCSAQKTITVEAQNNDISNNLDLQAVASAFGESSDLEDFERRLNDYDNQISNLDLNNDGEIDYLRVIENMENNVHVVVIQAVLDRDVYQDVATIVVERTKNQRTVVQVIGDPYLYGNDYIIEPVYVYTPSIFSFFWGYNYHSWYSPYYYGYYPRYYQHRHPFEVNYYLTHINSHINHNYRYYYTEQRRNEFYDRLHQSMRRNDYETRYPDRNFSNRNRNITNKKVFDKSRTNNTINERSRYINTRPGRSVDNNAGSRIEERRNSGINQRTTTPSTNNRNSGIKRSQDDVYQNRSTRPDNSGSRTNGNIQNNSRRTERNTNTPTYTAPSQSTTPATSKPEIKLNDQNNRYQQRTNEGTKTKPTGTRENNPTRTAPVINQPSRSTETKTIERKATENTRNKETEKGSRSTERR